MQEIAQNNFTPMVVYLQNLSEIRKKICLPMPCSVRRVVFLILVFQSAVGCHFLKGSRNELNTVHLSRSSVLFYSA